MQYLENTAFYYKDNELNIESFKISELVSKFGTPLFVYSSEYLLAQMRKFMNSLSVLKPEVFYAVKANNNISVIKTICSTGCGADVNSAGELYRAMKAGVPPDRIIFAGVGKTDEEIAYALHAEILLIKAESREEVEAINSIAGAMNKKARVALRVNPDVDAGTHPHISTGLAGNKFGLPFEAAKEIFLSGEFPNIIFSGIDMHIGSQIAQEAPYLDAVQKITDLIRFLKTAGVPLSHFDLGGGYGVDYQPDGQEFDLKTFAGNLAPKLEPLQLKILFEPGRFITANAGMLITRVLYRKINGGKNFVIVDAAMSELVRPALYSAYHHVQPVRKPEAGIETICDVVGPICESSDFFAKGRKMPEVQRGDLLAVCSAGAYGMVMSTNYNARLRPAEILVDRNDLTLIRKREKLEDMIAEET